jgi:hypothetical protein
LQWLGDRLAPIGHWFASVFSHVPSLLVFLLAFAAVAGAIAAAALRVRRRQSAPVTARRAGRIPGEESEDPAELERLADDAEREGRLDHALRLRFRAGLLRLGERGAIRYRPSLTTGEVRRALGSDTFDELARTFEGVAYGGRDASPPDLERARQSWPDVVAAATRKNGD